MKELIAVATAIDTARMAANAVDATAPQNGVYGTLAAALQATLMLILNSQTDVEEAYRSILDGCTVTEALVLLPESRTNYIVWPEA